MHPHAVREAIDLHLIVLQNVPIFEQLAIEEAFLRTDHRNICIINSGSPKAIVMGISGKVDALVDRNVWEASPVPIIKRFSGGGTVFIDPSTVFITWIFNQADVGVSGCPREIHAWSEKRYQSAFDGLNMRLEENDYVIGQRKFGGNAQYITKNRWLHHSSLLYDYDPDNMRYLLMPAKRPSYRQDRSHDDFLCTLRDYFAAIEDLQTTFLDALRRDFRLHTSSQEDIDDVMQRPHRRSTLLDSTSLRVD
jgi:lipoate-protein ligase A